MSKKLIIVSAVALLAIGFALGALFLKVVPSLGVMVSYDQQRFAGDIYQGNPGNMALIAQTGVLVGPVNTASLKVGSGGTMTKYLTGSTSTNIFTLGKAGLSTSTASTSLTVTGAALGDFCQASLTTETSTSPFNVSCKVQAANTVVVSYENQDWAVAVTSATGTTKVAAWR